MVHDFKNYPELTNNELQEMPFDSPHQQITESFWAKVEKVHDGDTITLKTDFRDFNFPLRFLDVDAPELNAGGHDTKIWLENNILGHEVYIIIDKNNRVDKYGRLLGKVLCNGLVMNEVMLSLGLVWPFARRREGIIPDKELYLKSPWR